MPGILRTWAADHLPSIFKLAKDPYDLHALEELILVTGYDVAKEYAMAVSMDHTAKSAIKFRVGIPDLADASAEAWGTWITLPSVVTNTGPQLRQNSTPNSDLPSGGPTDAVATTHHGGRNVTPEMGRAGSTVGEQGITDSSFPDRSPRQADALQYGDHVHALFIRGYRMRKRAFFPGVKIQAAAGYHNPGAADRDAPGDTELVTERTPEGLMVRLARLVSGSTQ